MVLVGIAAVGLASCGYFFAIPPAHSAAPSHWDDDTHHTWEEFVTVHPRRPSSASVDVGLGAAQRLVASQSAEATATTISEAATAGIDAPNLLYFNQLPRSFAMLDPREADFFHYQNGWEAQITQALCAVATTAAVLNSLRDAGIRLPVDPVYRPFPWATQRQLLAAAATDDCVLAALGGSASSAAAVYHIGLGLTMVPRLANCFLEGNGYRATEYPADDEGASASLKRRVLAALADPSSRVVYNYDRGGIGQGPTGHGHWSPLGGYHAASDSFLVMDVAKYKHPMVWVAWEDLWRGASTVDGCGETLSLKKGIDWNAAFADLSAYLKSRCIPGQRGFVVIEPVA